MQCNYCNKVMFGMQNHLVGTKTKKVICACPKVDEDIIQIFNNWLMGFEGKKKSKALDDECFQAESDGTLKSFFKKGT